MKTKMGRSTWFSLARVWCLGAERPLRKCVKPKRVSGDASEDDDSDFQPKKAKKQSPKNRDRLREARTSQNPKENLTQV